MNATTDLTEDVAADWRKKVARAKARKPRRATFVLHDEDAETLVAEKGKALNEARGSAALDLRADNPEIVRDDLVALVDKNAAVRRAQTAFDKAVKAAADAAITFEVQKIDPEDYDLLQHQSPPTEEQMKRGQLVNPHTLIPRLWAACSVQPLTEEDAEEIIAAGNTGDAGVIYEACRQVNEDEAFSLGKG